jgi:hypothetical protein
MNIKRAHRSTSKESSYSKSLPRPALDRVNVNTEQIFWMEERERTGRDRYYKITSLISPTGSFCIPTYFSYVICKSMSWRRVARFFLTQFTKRGEKYTKWPQNVPNGHVSYQIAVKYTNILHSEALQNLPKIVFENMPSGNPGVASKCRLPNCWPSKCRLSNCRHHYLCNCPSLP